MWECEGWNSTTFGVFVLEFCFIVVALAYGGAVVSDEGYEDSGGGVFSSFDGASVAEGDGYLGFEWEKDIGDGVGT